MKTDLEGALELINALEDAHQKGKRDMAVRIRWQIRAEIRHERHHLKTEKTTDFNYAYRSGIIGGLLMLSSTIKSLTRNPRNNGHGSKSDV